MEKLEQLIKNSSVEDKDRLILNLSSSMLNCINDIEKLEKETKHNTSNKEAYFLDKTYAKNDLISAILKIYEELGFDKIYKKEYQEMIECLEDNAETLGLFVQRNYKKDSKGN